MIALYKKQRAGSVFCVLLLLISISFSGCQKKDEDGKWLYTGEQRSAIEALYRKKMPDVLAEFQLEESDLYYRGDTLGWWELPEPVSIEGKDFYEELLFDISKENKDTFYGVLFISHVTDAEELPGYIDGLVKKITAAYGEPTTYPGILHRLTLEDFLSKIVDAMKEGTSLSWHEEWDDGEKTICPLTVNMLEMHVARITYEFKMRNPRVGWQNTD